MKPLGDKIKELRVALEMTQESLAECLGINVKSVQRYEKGRSRPDTYTLARLAVFFEVSSDYLLGISSVKEQLAERKNKVANGGGVNAFYKRYLKCKNEYTLDMEAIYYWIETDESMIGGQTMWAGWTKDKKEIRVLRPVIPDKAIEACTEMFGKPMVLNSEDDARIHLIFGGHAIVRKDICEKYLPWYLEPFIKERDIHYEI